MKITRIAFNSAEWRRPTGDAGKNEARSTFNAQNGFGFEDWLFRNEWQIAGWRYAFLQGVNKSHKKLLRDRNPFDVTLFTKQPDRRRRYVAIIRDIECLDTTQAREAKSVFEKRGWLNEMRVEIGSVGGNLQALDDPSWTEEILNVRFRIENISWFDAETFASNDDPIMKWPRYMLYDANGAGDALTRSGERRGSGEPPSLAPYLRRGTSWTEVSPEHARMQVKLLARLKRDFPEARVVPEENFIDVLVETNEAIRLYEIKSDLSPRMVLRQAIGQLLEYAYFQIAPCGRSLHLIVIGRNPLSDCDSQYLRYLQEIISLPLEYEIVQL